MRKANTFVEATTVEEVGRALAQGYGVVTTPAIAEQCGVFEEDAVSEEDAYEAWARPYGDREEPRDDA